MTEEKEYQLTFADLGYAFGKMSQEHSVRQAETISMPSSKNSQKSQTQMPLFLDLRTGGGGGQKPDVSWQMGGALLGEYTMDSFGESSRQLTDECSIPALHSEESVSRLSQILEDNVPEKYYLSKKACEGILRRAEKRGKTLPKLLEIALKMQAGLIPSRFGGGREIDSLGKRAGKGALIQTEKSGTLGVSQDQTLITAELHPGSYQNVTGPLMASGYDKLGTQEAQNDMFVVDTYCMDVGWLDTQTDKVPTLLSRQYKDPPIIAENHVFDGSRRHNCEEFGDVSETVQAHYGTGGNNQPIVVHKEQEPICIEMTSTKNTIIEDGISPTLTARMGTGGNQVNAVLEKTGINWDGSDVSPTLTVHNAAGQQRMPDKENFNAVITAVDCQNSTESADVNGTLQARAGGNLNSNNVCRIGLVVRRLTPGECEVLQGFPKGWTDIGEWTDTKGKKHKPSDAARYKALGNSICLPYWKVLARRISALYDRDITMASLFDGIGGFPLAFESCGGHAIWASEIEEFPIAVTKLRFPEE